MVAFVYPFVCLCSLYCSAGTSSTFTTRGLASLGLAGTHGLAGPIEEVPSPFKAGLGLASLAWTRGSLESRVPIHSSSVHLNSGITKTQDTCRTYCFGRIFVGVITPFWCRTQCVRTKWSHGADCLSYYIIMHNCLSCRSNTDCRYMHRVVTGPSLLHVLCGNLFMARMSSGPGLPVMEQFVTANNLIFLSC